MALTFVSFWRDIMGKLKLRSCPHLSILHRGLVSPRELNLHRFSSLVPPNCPSLQLMRTCTPKALSRKNFILKTVGNCVSARYTVTTFGCLVAALDFRFPTCKFVFSSHKALVFLALKLKRCLVRFLDALFENAAVESRLISFFS